MPDEPPDVTRLLNAAQAGEAGSSDRLVSVLYEKLRELAVELMKAERRNHTVQPTALVHEAWIRLVGHKGVRWENRAHFLGAAARAMRCFLVDYARARKAAKRGGGQVQQLDLDEAENLAGGFFLPHEQAVDLEALDAAMKSMESQTRLREKCKIVELHCFAGLTLEETAQMLGKSAAVVKRDWTFAKAWLRREISKRDG